MIWALLLLRTALFFIKNPLVPLTAIEKRNEKDNRKLTADTCAFHEHFVNFWIHLNVKVSVLSQLLIPFLNNRIYPHAERVADQSIDQVSDVFTQEFLNLSLLDW